MTPPPTSSDPLGAILLAAPSRTRTGIDLLRSQVADQPLAAWALAALRDTAAIGEIMLVVEPTRVDEAKALATSVGTDQARFVGSDGASVTAAIRAGLHGLSPTTRLVVILEAARPLVTPALLIAGIAVFAGSPDLVAACAASPVKETVKRVRDSVVVETLDRPKLALLSTPMIFDRAALDQASRIARADGGFSQVLRALRSAGEHIAPFPGGAENLAVATPDDLALADGLLRAREA